MAVKWLLLHVLFRYLYWGQQGADNAGIFRADLDGRNVIAIAASNIEQPTGMTFGECATIISYVSCMCVWLHCIAQLRYKHSTAHMYLFC